MKSIPDDVHKSFEIATKAFVDAVSFDSQILEDKLRYSNWISALAIAALLMTAANFSNFGFRPSLTMSTSLLFIVILSLATCVAAGGIYHNQVIQELEGKRQRKTLALKQHSLVLSTNAEFESKPPLCEQVWNFQFLSQQDRIKASDLKEEKGASSRLLMTQRILILAGLTAIFVSLFLAQAPSR